MQPQENHIEKMKNKGGRPRKYPEGASSRGYSLPKSMAAQLKRLADARGVSESVLLTQLLQNALNDSETTSV